MNTQATFSQLKFTKMHKNNLQPFVEIWTAKFDITGTRLLKQRLLELGQSFVDAGILEQAPQIFFLSPEDVRDARSHLLNQEVQLF